MNESPVRTVGRYHVEAVVGTGGFATVYRAEDPRLESTVAVKVLAENHSLNPELRERFLAEGRVLRRIDSAHVIRVHDLGETERQQPYLVLEYADRGTLAARVTGLRQRGWRPSSADLLSVLRPLAGAVAAVHQANVVHRDLAPGNVLLSSTLATPAAPPSTVVADDDRILLADLGLCKDLAINSGLTAAGGTEGFRAPEQRFGPTQIDGRADLWSLSALVVWLLSDAPPAGESVRDVVVAAGFPPALADVLDQSLAEDPAARHTDVAAWLDAVERALPATELAKAPAPKSSTPAPNSPARWRSRRGAVVLGTAGVALLGTVMAVLSVVRGGDEDVTPLDGGEVRVAVTDGDTEIAIEGPEEVTAGETAEFVAELDGVTSAVWISPEGESYSDVPVLEVQTVSPGTAAVTLVGGYAEGEPLVATHELRVTD